MRGAGAFDALFRTASRFEGRQVQVLAMPAAQPLGRFGLVVGRRALARAIDRNRFKRLVREALRQRRAEATAYDVVVRLKGPVKRAGVDAAAAEAVELLSRAFAALRAPRAP